MAAHAALRAAGALLIGKANLPDLSMGITSEHSTYGSVANPYAPHLHAFGSGGGVAAAVAAHVVPFGISMDTGGSMRIPAVLCGVASFRPSMDRYNSMGAMQQSVTVCSAGPVARRVRDLQMLDAILSSTTVEGRVYDPRTTAGAPASGVVHDAASTVTSSITSSIKSVIASVSHAR